MTYGMKRKPAKGGGKKQPNRTPNKPSKPSKKGGAKAKMPRKKPVKGGAR